MNVLSLFDGMSCGQIALDRLGVKYDKYYASEIDPHSIKVAKSNYPETIHLGDVTKIHSADLPQIDLLIGGSPCQGFSFAGKELNFEDPRSSLFFEYVRLLRELKPKYFLLENVVMQKKFQNIISFQLGVMPIMINSNLVSAQNRKRLYWTNIPNVDQPSDKEIKLNDILEIPGSGGRIVGRRLNNGVRDDYNTSLPRVQRLEINKDPQKSNCLSTVQKDCIVTTNESYRNLTILECERLQTVPDNYTSAACKSQRIKMLGNGWTVDVICHILGKIPKEEINTNQEYLNDFGLGA